MTIKDRSVAWGILLALVPTAASIASADCVIVNFDVRDAFRDPGVVFSGIVARVDSINDRLGFQVDRVWKGAVGREMWIYQLDNPSVESYIFRAQPDIKYIIFARQLSADERKGRVNADEPTAFGIHRSCGAGPRWTQAHARELDKIQKGRMPRK